MYGQKFIEIEYVNNMYSRVIKAYTVGFSNIFLSNSNERRIFPI
jgi:hypothetical protein